MILRIRQLAGFVLLGACAVAHAQVPAAVPDCGPKITAADCAKAMEELQASSATYMRQVLPLIESLARTGDADSLIAAAAFADIAGSSASLVSAPSTLPQALTRDALLARALHLAPDDAAILFAIATESCHTGASTCPGAAGRARLREVDADNAATWILELDRLTVEGKPDAARAALARAARTTTYRDYVNVLQQRVLRALLADASPVQPSDQASLDPRAGSRFLKFVYAEGMYIFTAPFSSHLMRLCDPQGKAMDAALRDDCRAVGVLLSQPTANEIMQGFGLRLQERLADDPAARDAFKWRRNVLSWRVRADDGWIESVDAAQVEEEIRILLESGSETERRDRQLALHSCAIAPPPGWTPPN